MIEALDADHLHHLAFDNSLLANIISNVSTDKIISANLAACKLLGYSKKELLTLQMKDIFVFSYSNFKQLLKKRERAGHAIGNLTILRKDGGELPCQITSVIFTGDHHIKKAITTLVDRSESIRIQKNIDDRKQKQVTADTIIAKSKADDNLIRLDELEHQLDQEINAKEQIQTSAQLQQIFFEKEWEEEIKLKEVQIADAIVEGKELERSDLGKELHDNINQLLAASRLYLDIARFSKVNNEMYLGRSSEYLITAIEEIRILTRKMVHDGIKHLGLCDAIHKLSQDIMEVYPLKIDCSMDIEIHRQLNARFNLNVFRIVQEQLNNIVKHASASMVKVDLSKEKEAIVLTISDNGVGFDSSKKWDGIGIENIKSRAASFDGYADFISQPGQGCTLKVRFAAQDVNG
ncbi:MAG TPA: PAS domain-containing protein [Puia sp.]|nr:PAS domain-containing protein [Puia sp.]